MVIFHSYVSLPEGKWCSEKIHVSGYQVGLPTVTKPNRREKSMDMVGTTAIGDTMGEHWDISIRI